MASISVVDRYLLSAPWAGMTEWEYWRVMEANAIPCCLYLAQELQLLLNATYGTVVI